MSILDLEMFSVSEAIVYDIIHRHHKHKHKEHLFKQQPIVCQNKCAKRKHRNNRRNELRPIKNSSRYYSPEVSETDEENPSSKRKVITKDLRWRSTTISLIMITLFKISKIRSHVQDTVGYYEKELSKPFLVPNWSVSGYEGSLKMAVQNACDE
ncbi:17862_t:CDS:2 [Dentiscutata erythropus]|uniref:17862_t:CDS:1 n=1 Tax=Dentiscutata erythropus TaxID=1348616 RepID=A0A9N8ZLN5_9GLOM|nr:17862_t:CDS:2 [Dentiscutata erythropus]